MSEVGVPRKFNKEIEIKHHTTINDETEVTIVFGDGTERIVKVPFETCASQRLGKYKHQEGKGKNVRHVV